MNQSPRRSISQLNAAERVQQVFLISQPQLRSTNRGDYYIAAYLSDSTGRINGRMWQATEEIFQTLPAEGFVWLQGRTENYQGSPQIVIDAIKPIPIEDVDLSEFLPATDRNIDEMFAEVKKIVSSIKNPHLARLCQAFLADEPLMRLFRSAPAAIALHHAYLGGLLEHTLSLMQLGVRILPQYPHLDADLVLTGLFLHDIGKTTELDYDISFKYSDQGRLLGHIVQGSIMVQQKIKELDSPETFPPVLQNSLLHIIVSHHGIKEFGCPVLPATPEAFAVHHLDNLDSKIALVFTEIDKCSNQTDWTNYVRAIEAPVYKRRPSEID